jgi:6-phosphogluconolactonase
MSPDPTIEILPDAAALALRALELFRAAARSSIRGQGRFTVALAGGATPRRLYEALADRDSDEPLPWERIHLFWGDERDVGPDDPGSNYRMAREALIDRIAIPEQNVHRIPAGEGSARDAAAGCERELRAFFGRGDGRIPSLDLVLLGLGEDGHTASLFPGSPLLADTERLVTSGRVEMLAAERISMTLRLINGAARVIFLVSGASKAQAAKRILEGAGSGELLPAARVAPAGGSLTWLLDAAAAADLEEIREG